MKAIYCSTYGPPSSLEIRELPIPEPKKNEVLVKVKAAAINDYDWSMVRGKPSIYRLIFGLSRPKNKIPGMEMSGVVEGIGPQASTFSIGDEVYGDISNTSSFSCFSDFTCVKEDALRKKPKAMSFEDAAAIPHASLLAWQGLINLGHIKKGMKILINGAGGGVGNFALQIAKSYEAQLTAVDSSNKLDTLKSMGYDKVIDYKKEDFTKNNQRYDLILDARTTRGPGSYLRALNEGGKYVSVGGTIGCLLHLLTTKWIHHIFTKKRIHILGLKPNVGLEHIEKLYKQNIIKPLIDGPYSFDEIPERIQYYGNALHKGKVIIRISE